MTSHLNPLVKRQLRLNQETLDHWSLYLPHRENIHRLLAQTLQSVSARLCVLGAGNCNDLDLTDLTSRFAQVHLVDLDQQGLVKGVERQILPDPERLILHGGFDITGILKTLANWQRNRPKQESIDYCVREAMAFVGLPFLGRFEVTISTCLLTQIIDSVVSITGSNSIPFKLIQALRLRHLRLLAELLLPGGVGILVTDFALTHGHTTKSRKGSPQDGNDPLCQGSHFLGVSPKELYKMVKNDIALQSVLHQAQITPPWFWQQNYRRSLLVTAIQFRRRNEQPRLLEL